MKRMLYLGLSICFGISYILNTEAFGYSKRVEAPYFVTNRQEISKQKSNEDMPEIDLIETETAEIDITKTNTSLKYSHTNWKYNTYYGFNKILLDIDTISQYPELPTGCEITSLTIVLNYLGFDVSKVTMAQKYLDTAKIGTASYWDSFLGDPETEAAYGCFAPVIVEAAEEYLEDMDSELRVYDLTGSSLIALYDEVRKGNPVIVWGSMDIVNSIYFSDFWEIDGETIWWYANEHCMVLSGYDLIQNTVTVCDPLRDIEEYDFDAFNENYIAMESQAIVIK